MTQEINDILKAVEEKHSIHILYAVESGSRAWGFASQNSDWDVRFIYIHNLQWYLDIDEKKDNIEAMYPGDIDIAGWELKKALRLFRKSNPPLLEWLHGPIVYKEQGNLAELLRAEMRKYFNPKNCLHHYYHMAKGNWEAYFKTDKAKLKKYFYVLRPVLACSWIVNHDTMPPVLFEKLMNTEVKNPEVTDAIEALLFQKISGMELDYGDRFPVLDAFIEEAFGKIASYIAEHKFENKPDWQTLNQIFTQTLYAVSDN